MKNALLFVFGVFFAWDIACERNADRPEKAHKEIRDAGKKVGRAIEKAADKLGEGVEKIGDRIEDAAESKKGESKETESPEPNPEERK